MFTFLLLPEIVIERVSKELLAITNNKLVFFTITQNMKKIIVRTRKMAKFFVLIWNKEMQEYLHYQSPNADYKIQYVFTNSKDCTINFSGNNRIINYTIFIVKYYETIIRIHMC